MANEKHRSPLANNISHFAQAFFLKGGISNRQDLVHNENLGLKMCRYRKSQAHLHSAGVTLDRRIDELFNLGKGDDFVEFASDLVLGHAQNGTVEEDVFAPGKFGVEAGADFQQAGDAPFDPDLAGGWGGDAGEDCGASDSAVGAESD